MHGLGVFCTLFLQGHVYSNNCIIIETSGLPHLAITPIGEMSLVHSFFIVLSYAVYNRRITL